jgi:catechol 2,3-dioxygenase-like lactoylglutathione lyase family enzyme
MYDHIGIKVGNLDASVRFYTAALAPLGFVLCSKDESGAGFGPKGEPALWLYRHKDPKGAGAHIAFRAPDHAAITKFHAEGLKGRRPRQWRRRSAQRLQPDLLRGVSDRPRRQQCRGGVHLICRCSLSRHCERKRSNPGAKERQRKWPWIASSQRSSQ